MKISNECLNEFFEAVRPTMRGYVDLREDGCEKPTIPEIADYLDEFRDFWSWNPAEDVGEVLDKLGIDFSEFVRTFLAIRRHNRRHPADKIRWNTKKKGKILELAYANSRKRARVLRALAD